MKKPKLPRWLNDMIFASAATADPMVEAAVPETNSLELTGRVDIAAAGDASGKRPSFTIHAYDGGVMTVAAFFSPVIVDLQGLRAARPKLPILMAHDVGRIVGQADKITIDAHGIKLEGMITGDGGDAAAVVTHAKNGFEWQASIGARVDRREFLDAGKTAIVNGREITGPIIIARQATLVETSFVAVGAAENTAAKIAAEHGGSNMLFQDWLKAQGITNFDSLSEPVQKQLKAAWEASKTPTTPAATGAAGTTPATQANGQNAASPPTNLAASGGAGGADPATQATIHAAVTAAMTEARTQWEATQKRRDAILAATAGHADIQAKALAESWSVERAELEVIRASRPAGFFVNTGAGTENIRNSEVLTAALCMSGRLDQAEKAFDAPVLQAAHTRFRSRIGLQQFLLEAAWHGGHIGRHFDISAGGLQQILRAAFSNADISGILSNVANKFLLQGFMGVENGWRSIAFVRPVNDFKRSTSYRLTGDFEFEEVGNGGELKHAQTSEEEFGNQARTHGKMYAITRQDIINDDLGALSTIPQRIGRGGALKLNKVFWTEFMDNATFFVAGNNNYQEGAGTVLGIDSLTAAELLFFNQVDADNQPLGLTAATLLVPNALNVTGTQLMRETEVRDTTASKKYTTGNPHAGKFEVVRSSYLSNATIAGNSTTAWYLLANPQELAVIEVVFLNGQEQPTVETAEANFETLGIQMRGYFDFGVEKQDHRAGVKSKGAA